MNPIATAVLIFCSCGFTTVAVKRVRFFHHRYDGLYLPEMESQRQFDKEADVGCYLDEVILMDEKPMELIDYLCECSIKPKSILRRETKYCRPNLPPPTEATGLTPTQLMHLRKRTQQGAVIRDAFKRSGDLTTESQYQVCVAYLKLCQDDAESLPCPEKTIKAAEEIIKAWDYSDSKAMSSSSSSSYGAEFFEE